VEHHLSHAASAFYGSGFEESAILTWDGRGESTTTLLAVGRGNKIEKLDQISIPHSLGHLFASITDYLGFRSFNDEGKVMGMAAYGRDTYVSRFREVLRLEERGRFNLNLDYFRFHTHGRKQWLSEKFLRSFGPPHGPKDKVEQRHFDIAYALQKTVEEAGVHVARHLYDITRLPSLCMTGGVALNVLLNQRVIEKTPFERFFIQPVASDSGTSFGSALYYYHQICGKPSSRVFDSVYLGPEYTNDEIEAELKSAHVNYVRSENIERDTARHIFDGKIVGWFQGRMEAGPRALGNRSIVVNPMDSSMKSRLNERVKKRESFRPFAPSVLEERVSDFFEMPKSQLSPYMILAGNVRAEKRPLLPAVTHLDGTARVHTVSNKTNPRYWRLIKEFESLSGIGVLLNTSFNENEPIVCTPKDAIRCFLRTEFDVLGIGDFLVTK
jgi:carbamoyltransferase